MKTLFPLIAATAFIAFLALPFSAEITGSVAFVAGLASIIAADYGRRTPALLAQPVARSSSESYRLAA
ncbi:MAG: hypothetical protein ABIZ04_06840 [Opitutus sp.]